ncbi:MAG TPA: hypothetical protein VMW24_28520 [Sedimentisphaerales bacterium]|nr:hypothetical protein [Sedimentisphaerales bacterium]
MTEQDSCRSCVQKHECQRVYEQIGNTSGSSVAVKVSLAFLLPLVVFIAALAASQRVLAGVAEPAQTAISLALALASALGCILAVRVISGKSCQDR